MTGLTTILKEIGQQRIPPRAHRTCPRAIKRGRHNSYRIKRRNEPASTRHNGPPTIRLHHAPKAA